MLGLAANAWTWTIRLLFPSEHVLGRTTALCEQYDVPLEIRSITHVGDGATGQYGLTSLQYDSLRLAYERGYYGIPRGTQLSDLADEVGISHQAYSERLRRATETLLERTLLNAAPTDGER